MMLLAMWIIPVFAVYAQNRTDITVFLAGTAGGSAEERAFFDQNLKMELTNAYLLAENADTADYVIYPTITYSNDDPPKSLGIRLVRVEDKREIIQTGIVFLNTEDTYTWNLWLIFQAMANAPYVEKEELPPEGLAPYNYWRDKWLYFGLSAFYNPQVIDSTYQAPFTSFGGMLAVELQFLNFLSVEAGVRSDTLYYRDIADGMRLNLAFPASLKVIFKPGKDLMIEPHAGVAFNLPLHEKIVVPLFTPFAGVQLGIRFFALGALFLNAELWYDSGPVEYIAERPVKGDRWQMLIGAGLKLGVFNRPIGPK
jgi:hypothetical protein